MKPKSIKDQSRKLKESVGKASAEKYCLRLFVTGTTPKSLRAITNIKLIFEAHLKGRYILEVVDIYQQPD